jgi:hypothetical protein
LCALRENQHFSAATSSAVCREWQPRLQKALMLAGSQVSGRVRWTLADGAAVIARSITSSLHNPLDITQETFCIDNQASWV